VLVGLGATLVIIGRNASSGPDDAVRGYFAALARGDAPAALAFGVVPGGDHTLLTSTVLAEQNRIAPLRDVRVGPVQRNGASATVHVRFTVAFPGAPQVEQTDLEVDEQGGQWRLAAVAVPTQLGLPIAAQRATVVGAPVPDGTVLVFPGAVPISFDTPYLALSPSDDVVNFGADPTTQVVVNVSDAGRRAALHAVMSALDACLAGTAGAVEAACPVPDSRAVPGTLRGTAGQLAADQLSVIVDSSPVGELSVTGGVPVQASSFEHLDFDNQPTHAAGRVTAQVFAHLYAVQPLVVNWVSG
jgi:hypothetical protein